MRTERVLAVALCSLIALGPWRGFAADSAEADAKKLFKEGQKEYDLGHFEQALKLFTDAYSKKPAPGVLFNLAQCHRQLGNWEQAAFFFGRFIDNSNPRTPNIEVARELLEDARKKQAAAEEAKAADEKKRAEEEDRRAKEEEARRAREAEAQRIAEQRQLEAVPPPPPPPQEEPVTKKAWFWVLVGGGVAAVAAGGITAGVLLSQPRPAELSPVTLGTIDAR